MKTLSVYGIAYLLLLMLVIGLQYAYSKVELHMLLNSYHTGILNTFFKYLSVMAEWPLYIIALLPLFWKKIKITLFFVLSELIAGGLLQIVKHTIDHKRPVIVFEKYQDLTLPLVEGVNMHHSNSFPSGHASTFFVFCTCCAIILAYYYIRRAGENDHRMWFLINVSMLLLMVFAALGAYSRVYLSQHFLSDVFVGSIIGFVTPCLLFYFGRKKIFRLKNVGDSIK